jgi:hypothetical protein
MRNFMRFWYVLRFLSCDVGVNGDIPPPPLPKLGCVFALYSAAVGGGSIPRGFGVIFAPSLITGICLGSRAAAAAAEAWKNDGRDAGGAADVHETCAAAPRARRHRPRRAIIAAARGDFSPGF